MKKIIPVLLLWLAPCLAYGQISVRTYNAGTRTVSGEPINAQVYTTGRPLHSWNVIDAGQKILIAEGDRKGRGGFRKKGTVACYDLDDCKLLWSRSINYKWQKPQYSDSLMIVENNGSRYFKSYYDAITGEPLHESPDIMLGLLPDGYLLRWTPGMPHGILSSVRRDGAVRWEMFGTGAGVPSEFSMPDDTTMVLLSDGLFNINVNTGKGWHYRSSTTVPNRNAAKSAWALRLNDHNINYFAGNIVWSLYPLTASVENIHTNVYGEDGRVYWASAEKLVCLTSDSGEAVWEVPLGITEASPGTVFIADGKLYHFNHGYVELNRHYYRFGEPYVAVYDPATGEQVSKLLTGRMLNFIVDYENRTAHIITEEGVYPYMMEEGRMNDPLLFKEDLDTEFIPFYIRGDAIIKDKDGEGFRSLYQVYPSDCFALALGGLKSWVVSGNSMEVLDEISWDRLLVPHKMTGSHIIASETGWTHFLDIAQQSAARVKAGHEAKYEGKYMFWSDGRSIFRVDLSEFIPEIREDGDIMDYGMELDEKITIY